MRWAAIVPLVGGQVLGTKQALGHDPEAMFSFPDFALNDGYIARHLPHVPFHSMVGDRARSTLRGWRGKLDLVVSTCPCAGLSMLSPFKSDDPRRGERNKWMLDTTDMVLDEVQPHLLLGENAPQLATALGAEVVHGLRTLADRHDYSLLIWKTSSVLASVPQHRTRSFYMLSRRPLPDDVGLNLAEPMRTTSPLNYLQERAGGREDDPVWPIKLETDPLHRFISGRIPDWTTRRWNEPRTDALHVLMKSDWVDEFCATYPLESGLVHSWDRMNVSMVHRLRAKKAQDPKLGVYAQTPILLRGDPPGWPAVTAKTAERLVHPQGERYLTYREAASLMGLPRDFTLPPLRNWNIICQNVPVDTAAQATRAALRIFGAEAEVKGRDFVLYDRISGRDRTDEWDTLRARGRGAVQGTNVTGMIL